MKIKTVQDLSNVSSWEELRRFVSQTVTSIIGVVNGGINLTDNCDTEEVSFTFNVGAAEASAKHGLGRVPTRFIVTSNTTGIVAYNGASANTADTFYLRATGAGTITVILE